MVSLVLVTLQFALMAAIAVPFGAFAWNGWATALLAVGAMVGAWTLTANRLGNFNVRPEPKIGGKLVTGGPYRYVRHPMYLAVLVGMAAFCAAFGAPWRWGALVALAVVLRVKAGVEERHLTVRHPGYAEYARGRKRFIPFVW